MKASLRAIGSAPMSRAIAGRDVAITDESMFSMNRADATMSAVKRGETGPERITGPRRAPRSAAKVRVRAIAANPRGNKAGFGRSRPERNFAPDETAW